jgi:hypothetical protein
MTHHPHVHMIVTGGGISPDGSRWIASRPDYLLPVEVLSALFCGRMLGMLIDAHLDTEPCLHDLRCAVGASQISIAPADRAAQLPRFPSLAAFERRPGGRCAFVASSVIGAGIRNPSHKETRADH